jgi:uncharacterized lipoprotein YehR (DUF1307 family)
MEGVAMSKLVVGILAVLALAGCTDAERSASYSYGDEHKVTLYSDGQSVREWRSSGKVLREDSGSGYYFREKNTGVFVRVIGNVVVETLK